MENIWDIIAIIISVVALFIAAWSGLITRKHNQISIKPYCAIIERYHEHNIAVVISNRGLGPLVIDHIDVYNSSEHKDNLIELLPQVDQLWKGFSLEICGRAIMPDHEVRLCAIEPETPETRTKILEAISDITISLTYHDSYGKKYKLEKKLTWSAMFLNNTFGYRAE